MGRSRTRATRPLAAPAVVPPSSDFPPLRDYGAIGDLRTALLVSRHGVIEWACMPSFESASVFAQLLDRTRGGSAGIAPVGPYESRQEYVSGTNILTTRFDLPAGGRLTLTDFMPLPVHASDARATSRVLRRIQADPRPVAVQIWVEPRFEYGRLPARWRQESPTRWRAERGPRRLFAQLPRGATANHGRLSVVVDVAPRAPCEVRLGWGTSASLAGAFDASYRATERTWRHWVHSPQAPLHRLVPRWRATVERSELALKLLSNARTGAFVAALTTSLPEWPGEGRNWDYRYSWVRDAAFTAQAMLLLDHRREALDFLRWIVQRLREGSEPRPRVAYRAEGKGSLRERVLPHLSGYRDSRPVRVGNAAWKQFQLGIYGEVLDCALRLALVGEGEPLRDDWPVLARLAEQVVRQWRRPDQGIWESRGPPEHYVHSKLMAWVALDRALRIAEALALPHPHARWDAERAAIHAWIVSEGVDRRDGYFLQRSGSRVLDSANLRIPLVGFLPFTDPRVVATVARVDAALGRGPFVWRFRSGPKPSGPEGAFLPCCFWRIECLAGMGEHDRALSDWKELLRVGEPLGLFAEEYDPTAGEMLGNYPQALTHLSLLRAAMALGLAHGTRRARESLALALEGTLLPREELVHPFH